LDDRGGVLAGLADSVGCSVSPVSWRKRVADAGYLA